MKTNKYLQETLESYLYPTSLFDEMTTNQAAEINFIEY